MEGGPHVQSPLGDLSYNDLGWIFQRNDAPFLADLLRNYLCSLPHLQDDRDHR